MDKPWKVILAFIGIFIAGSVFGGFFALRIGGRMLQMQAPHQAPAGKGGPMAQPRGSNQIPQPLQAAQLMRRYSERLDLTTEQKERIGPVIQRAAEDLRRQQQTNFRETNILVQRLQEDVAKVLRPEQRVRLEKMEQNQGEMRKLFGERFGAPGQRPGEREKRNGLKAAPPGGAGGISAPPAQMAPSGAALSAPAPTAGANATATPPASGP